MHIRSAAAAAMAAALILSACATPMARTGTAPSAVRVIGTEYPSDPFSFSNPNDAVVQHLDLDLSVNFPEKKLAGLASLVIENRTGVSEIRLDAR
ncbi:MAG TPA: aminopeptidase, partial [Thermoanaerobaculia bacterium]|nr:aminopeptidase [Thermoanaerobaculia bacterium]